LIPACNPETVTHASPQRTGKIVNNVVKPKKGGSVMLSHIRKLQAKAQGFIKNEKGQGLVEYALILVLIAIVVMAAVKNVGLTTSSAYSKVDSGLKN
jgi:pilus assembly protein Flp/PilA